jgi:hypothetical protein
MSHAIEPFVQVDRLAAVDPLTLGIDLRVCLDGTDYRSGIHFDLAGLLNNLLGTSNVLLTLEEQPQSPICPDRAPSNPFRSCPGFRE